MDLDKLGVCEEVGKPTLIPFEYWLGLMKTLEYYSKSETIPLNKKF